MQLLHLVKNVLASLISKITGSIYPTKRKNFLLNSQHTLVFVYGNVHTLAGLESVWIIFPRLDSAGPSVLGIIAS